MIPKPFKIRSKKITSSARGETCTVRNSLQCAHEETVVFAHLPGNKGTSTKNHDLFGVFCCHFCHFELDNGNVSAKDQLRALQETQLRLVTKELIIVK